MDCAYLAPYEGILVKLIIKFLIEIQQYVLCTECGFSAGLLCCTVLHKMAIAEAGDVVHGQLEALSTLSTQALSRPIAILRLASALILTKGLMQRGLGHKGTFTAKQRIGRREDVAVTGQLVCLQRVLSQMVHENHQATLSFGFKAAQENVGTLRSKHGTVQHIQMFRASVKGAYKQRVSVRQIARSFACEHGCVVWQERSQEGR